MPKASKKRNKKMKAVKVVNKEYLDWYSQSIKTSPGITVSWPRPWPEIPENPECSNACGSIGFHVMLDVKNAFMWGGHYPAHAFEVEVDGILANDGKKLRVLEYRCLDEISLAPVFGQYGNQILRDLDNALALPGPRTASDPLDKNRVHKALANQGEVIFVGLQTAWTAWAARDAKAAWAAWAAWDAKDAWGALSSGYIGAASFAWAVWHIAIWPAALHAQGKVATIQEAIRDDILGQGCLLLGKPKNINEIWVSDPAL